jgi:hypothetical protein
MIGKVGRWMVQGKEVYAVLSGDANTAGDAKGMRNTAGLLRLLLLALARSLSQFANDIF